MQRVAEIRSSGTANLETSWLKSWLWGVLGLLLVAGSAWATVPEAWPPRGLGGGGALYGISFQPYGSEIFLACDMSEVLRSVDLGATWDIVPANQLQANQRTVVRFTSDPTKLYGGDSSVFKRGGFAPRKSTDGGQTWIPLLSDPTQGAALALHADYAQPDRLVLADDTTLYFSSDGGGQFLAKHTAASQGSGLFVGGVVFDGADIYVASNDGLLVSHDNGSTFLPEPMPGITAGELPGALAGARDASGLTLVLATHTTLTKGLWQSQIYTNYAGLYRFDPQASSWLPATGIGASSKLSFVAMAGNDGGTAYAMGYDATAKRVRLYKSVDRGSTWNQTLFTNGNQNIETGWAGEGVQGAYKRWWGDWDTVPNFLAVSPVDSSIVGFDDGGFLHTSVDGGASWQAAYVPQAERHAVNTPTSAASFFHGNGLENTVAHWLLWLDDATLLSAYSDIQGARSLDGGYSWAPYVSSGGSSGPPIPQDGLKDFNKLVVDASGTVVYASTAAIGPLYRPPIITDSYLDLSGGRIVFTTNAGASWQTLHDFGHPVAALALDPTAPNRLYAAVVHHVAGGIQVSNDIQNGSASTWAPAAIDHARMEGHPQSLHVLNDGMVVATFSARQPTVAGGFTNSAGVFVLPLGAAQWEDRSDPGMYHFARHLTVDPHFADQSVWYVGTFSSWNNGAGNIPGALYRTTNWGGSWQKIWDQPVESCTVDPNDSDSMYVATDRSGLWHTSNLSAAQPSFVQVDSYPFRGPERVFFHNSEVWVTSFGNGIRVGTVPTATPTVTATATASATATETETAMPPPTPGNGLCGSGIMMLRPRLTWDLKGGTVKISGQAVIPKPWVSIDPVNVGVRVLIQDSNGILLDVSSPTGSGWNTSASADKWTYRTAGAGAMTRVTIRDRSKRQDGLLTWKIQLHAPASAAPDPAQMHTSVWLGNTGECSALDWNPPGQAKPACNPTTSSKMQCR